MQPINLTDARAIRFITPTDTTAFVDDSVQFGRRYTYVVTSLDRMNNESVASSSSVVIGTPTEDLASDGLEIEVSPNPFSESLEIRYEIEKRSFIFLVVNDLQGREVARLVQQSQSEGIYTVSFRPVNLPSGVYIIGLKTQNGFKMQKVVLQK